jgi:Fanconi-associated nuclease 1
MMEAVIDVQDELFSDSDTDYASVESDNKKKKRKIIASPRVSRQLKKTRSESNTSNIELKSSPKKSPRSLKQQFSLNLSPGKKPIISPNSNPRHIPLNTENRKDPDHIPYYLVNFECILRGVIDETDDKELFKDDELKTIEDFRTLSLDAKKLFVRLFQRKHSWLLQKAINYEEIQNVEKQLADLCSKGFLRSSSDLNDLETILNILSSPAVKQLCKGMNIGPKGNLKKDCIEALMKHSRKKSFFTKHSDTNNSMVNVILKKARDVIDTEAYHVDEQAHLIFKRVLSLYSLSNFWDERENDRGSPRQLTTILLQNTGKLTFPVYKIVRERRIFQSRDDLLEFESSCSLESDLCEQMAEKNWEEAIKPAEVAVKQFQDLFVNLDKMEYTKSLPVYLRRFTNGSVLAYVITKGVEIYEKLKDYDNAVRLLRQLLLQDVFLSDYHGHWYERLILDLDQHLKKPKDAIDAIWQGLNDPFVQEARLFTLCQRFLKLSTAKKKSALITVQDKQKFVDHNRWLAPQEPQTLTIQGRMMPKSNRPGEKTVFVAEGAENDLLCSVEEFVREHYKRHEGPHLY